MRYRLRTLLIVLALGPPLLAGIRMLILQGQFEFACQLVAAHLVVFALTALTAWTIMWSAERLMRLLHR